MKSIFAMSLTALLGSVVLWPTPSQAASKAAQPLPVKVSCTVMSEGEGSIKNIIEEPPTVVELKKTTAGKNGVTAIKKIGEWEFLVTWSDQTSYWSVLRNAKTGQMIRTASASDETKTANLEMGFKLNGKDAFLRMDCAKPKN